MKLIAILLLIAGTLSAEEAAAPAAVPAKEVKPFRTFITVQRYNIENNGDASQAISNIALTLISPEGKEVELPGSGQYWPIGNGQAQEIDRTFEVPFALVQKDGFKFQIQITRKGASYLPCQFDIVQLSEFNRTYVCHTDINWQKSQNIKEEAIDKQGVQIRIFTDMNSKPKEIPQNAIAFK